MDFKLEFLSPHQGEDPFVISDSDEEVKTSSRVNKTETTPIEIIESDAESEDLEITAIDSDEMEDLKFINSSHIVSIIEDSEDELSHETESDSDFEIKKINTLKRESIYDNDVKIEKLNALKKESIFDNPCSLNALKRKSIYDNPSSFSTPKSTPTKNHLYKRAKKNVVGFELDSKNFSLNHGKNSIEKIEPKSLNYNDDDDEDMGEIHIVKHIDSSSFKNNSNLKESTKQTSNCENLNKSSDNVKYFNNNEEKVLRSKYLINNISELKVEENPFPEEKTTVKSNFIDLTLNDLFRDHSKKIKNENAEKENVNPMNTNSKQYNSLQKLDFKSSKDNQKHDDDNMICSSMNTSENEIDNEAILLAKKEIGLANIDFLEAQKREHLLLNIDFTQKQLDKLMEFAESADIDKLLDKGAKVHQTIKEHKKKIMMLRLQLAMLETANSSQDIFYTPETDHIKKETTNSSVIDISDEEDFFDITKYSKNTNIKKECNSNGTVSKRNFENSNVKKEYKSTDNLDISDEEDFYFGIKKYCENTNIKKECSSNGTLPKIKLENSNVKKEYKSSDDLDISDEEDFHFGIKKYCENANIKEECSLNGTLPKIKLENNNVKKEYKPSDDFSNRFNNFNIEDIPNLPSTSFNASDLGKKALETLNKQQSLTHQGLKELHDSLTSRPNENQRAKDPNGLRVPLMAHQQHALAWMLWREKQKCKGGILADDMGLGKTLSMISLVLTTLHDQKQNNDISDSDEYNSDDEWMPQNKYKRYYGGTLVICPASLMRQWEIEVKSKCERGLMKVLVFHGINRSMNNRKLSKYDIVITSYQTIVREAEAESDMYKLEWNRIILDEAHYIRNHKSKACVAMDGLDAKYRWVLTGTPIQNKELDLLAILMFLKCTPFNELAVWKRWVENKSDAGKQRLITIMKTIMLRRTKQELQEKGAIESLPDKNIEIIEIELDHEENLAYQKLLLYSQNLFAQFLAQRSEKRQMEELYGNKFDKPSYLGANTKFTKAQKILLEQHSGKIQAHEILVYLLRLRQICCHPALIHAMLDKEDAEGLEDNEIPEDVLNRLHDMSIDDDENVDEHAADFNISLKVAKNLLTKKNPVFNDDRRSSKVRKIIKTVRMILENKRREDKIIVVSQWTSFLKVIAKNLDTIEGANYAKFTGEIAIKNRQQVVENFNNPKEDVNILLLSLAAGGVGLNLIGANHLLLADIHWNPQLEFQAQDRIYRFGQKKSVYIYKFLCKDTIEQRVKTLQDKKIELANHVLTGTKSVSSKLTIDDLKLLFS